MADSGNKTNALLVAGLIVASTVGAMVWMSDSDESAEADGASDQVATEVIEIEPMVPRARIANASWRTGTTRASEKPVGGETSLMGSAEWENLGTDQETLTKNEESLRKAMEKVQGLGVVVAEEDDEETPEEMPRKRK